MNAISSSYLSIILFSSLIIASPNPSIEDKRKCEDINIPMCKGIGYNKTSMPNAFQHDSQEEAGLEVHQFWPLVQINCSSDLSFFLCSMYTPICIEDYPKPLPACSSVCRRAKAGCGPIMSQYGFIWPDKMNCDDLPMFGDNNRLCMDSKSGEEPSPDLEAIIPEDHLSKVVTMSPKKNPNNKENKKKLPSPSSTASPKSTVKSINLSSSGSEGLKCPVSWKTPPGQDYRLKIRGQELINCAVPCDSRVLLSSLGSDQVVQERKNIRLWISIWSCVCIISTSFTIFTFLIDRERFQYPQRPVIFLCLCYLGMGISYFVSSFFLEDEVVCNKPFLSSTQTNPSIPDTVATVIQGNNKSSCILSFVFTYFSMTASLVWWVILSFSWFLASGRAQLPETIESNSHYFHLVGWILPAILTINVLALGKIEGDVLSGVCSVGNWNQDAVSLFVVTPSVISLVLGFLFVTMSFFSFWKLRNAMKRKSLSSVSSSNGRQKVGSVVLVRTKKGVIVDHDLRTETIEYTTKTNRLERLMIRIGFFALIYMTPMIVLLFIYHYESVNMDSWINTWVNGVCYKDPQSGICLPPQSMAGVYFASSQQQHLGVEEEHRPHYLVNFVKYLVMLLPGVMSGFWITSEKTLYSWRRFLSCLCCQSHFDSRGYVSRHHMNHLPSHSLNHVQHHQPYSNHTHASASERTTEFVRRQNERYASSSARSNHSNQFSLL